MLSNPWVVLALFFIACFIAAGLASVWTTNPARTWYPQLQKPPLTPHNRVFTVVWSGLYSMMALSAWLVWRAAGWGGGRVAFVFFFFQLALNVSWSGLFFRMRRPGVALVDAHLLLAAIVATAIVFRAFSQAAFWLLVPYAGWVGFATYLNFRLWQLNDGKE